MARQTRIYGSGIPKDSAEEAQYAERVRAGVADGEPEGRDPGLAEAVEEFRAEALSSFAGSVFGDPFGLVVAVKANPPHTGGVEGASASGFLAAPDGIALAKALDSLGYPAESLFGVQLGTSAEGGGRAVTDANLRSVIELVDPVSIVALDARAAQAVERAYGAEPTSPARLPSTRRLLGRTVVLLDDFEACLGSQEAKRRAWAALKGLSIK